MTNRKYVLDIPFEERALGSALKAKWDPQLKSFVYDNGDLPELLETYKSQDFSWERWLEDDLNKKISPVYINAQQFTPRPHQFDAAKKIASAAKAGLRGFVEADEIGLGKTLSCLYGAYGTMKVKGFSPSRKAKVLILCPKSAIPHWRNTISATKIPELSRIVVANYEKLPKFLSEPAAAKNAKKTRTKNKAVANKGIPLVQWDIIIADEAHLLKNYQTAQRVKAFANVGRYNDNAKAAPFIIYASATLGQQPLDFAFLAPLIGQVHGKKLTLNTWGEYLESQGYAVKKGKVGWAWATERNFPNGGTAQLAYNQEVKELRLADRKRLRKILSNSQFPYIRRIPENISGWPKIQMIPYPIQFESKAMSLYKRLWTEFRQAYQLGIKGKDPASALAQQIRFRQKSSMLKVPSTADMVKDFLERGYQVAVSALFVETVDALKEALGGDDKVAEITSRIKDTEAQRLDFQKGRKKVIVFSVKEAISLHSGESLADGTSATAAKRVTIIHDLRYSGIETSQILGRAHRDGTFAPVYFTFAEGTVEKKIVHSLIDKVASIKDISGDEQELVDEIDSLLLNY